jgi:hypothetical protein
MPKKLAESENEALATPVTLFGTGEELDADLSSTLINFVGAHLELRNTIDSAKAEMVAAAKAAKAQAKPNTPAKPVDATVVTNKPEDQTPKPASDAPKSVVEKKAVVPRTASLFDMPAPPDPVPAAVPASVDDNGAHEEEQIMAEIGEETQDDESLEDAA